MIGQEAVDGPDEGHAIWADQVELLHGRPEFWVMFRESRDMGIGRFDRERLGRRVGMVEDPIDCERVIGDGDGQVDDGDGFQGERGELDRAVRFDWEEFGVCSDGRGAVVGVGKEVECVTAVAAAAVFMSECEWDGR